VPFGHFEGNREIEELENTLYGFSSKEIEELENTLYGFSSSGAAPL